MNASRHPGDSSAGSEAAGWSMGVAGVAVRHPGILASALLLAIAAGSAYLRYATPQYTSSSRLLIEPLRPRVIDEAAAPVSMDEAAAFLATQKAVITSVPVLTRAIVSLAPVGSDSTDNLASAVIDLRKQVRVSVGRRDNLVSVEFDAPSPADAAAMVRAVVDAYIAFQSDQQRESGARLQAILAREKADCDAALAKTRAGMLELRRSAAALSLERGDGAGTRMLQTVNEALVIARLEAANAEAAYAGALEVCRADPEQMKRVEELDRSADGAVSGEVDQTWLRSAIAEAEQQKLELTRAGNCLPNHPRVRALSMRLDHLRAMQVVSLKRRAQSMRAREATLMDETRRQEAAAANLAGSTAELSALEAQLQQLERQSDVIERRIREVRAGEAAGALNIRVLEPASMPMRSSKPSTLQTMALAALAGLFLGIAGAYVRELARRRTREDPQPTAIASGPDRAMPQEAREPRRPQPQWEPSPSLGVSRL